MGYGDICVRQGTKLGQPKADRVDGHEFARCIVGPNAAYIDDLVPGLESGKGAQFCVKHEMSADPKDWRVEMHLPLAMLSLYFQKINGTYKVSRVRTES